MLKVTRQQRENLLYALNVMWPAILPEQVIPGLGRYRSRCGTAACFGGWVAVDPHFAKQGVKAHDDSNGWTCGCPKIDRGEDDDLIYGEGVARLLFGVGALFAPRCTLPRSKDDDLKLPYESYFDIRTDHEIVRDRLQFVLENSEVEDEAIRTHDEVTS